MTHVIGPSTDPYSTKRIIPRHHHGEAENKAKRGEVGRAAANRFRKQLLDDCDQHDGAPAANSIKESIRARGADRKNNTGTVPSAVSPYVPSVATNA